MTHEFVALESNILSPMDAMYFDGLKNDWVFPITEHAKRLKRFYTDDISSLPKDRHAGEDDNIYESDESDKPDSEEEQHERKHAGIN